MPSEKILTEKQALVAALNEKMVGACAGVVVSFKGITVEADTKLRKELRVAVKGTSLESLAESFKGDTAIAISKEDPIAAARILNKFAEADKSKSFTIKGGYMDGNVMSAAEVCEIAKLPDLKGMLSMFAGALTSTLSGMAVAMQAYVDKQEGEAA